MTKPKSEKIELDTQGQLAIELDARYLLRPSFKAIAEAERETGLALFDLASLAANSRMSLDQMGVVVAALMRAQGEACPEDALASSYRGAKADNVAPMIFEAGAPRIMIRLAIILAGAVNGGYTSSGEAKAATN